MNSIHKRYKRFLKISNGCVKLLNNRIIDNTPYQFTDYREISLYSVSILNNIWQLWNAYWRNYWLTHLFGGLNTKNVFIPALGVLGPNASEPEALHYLLYKLGKRNTPVGRIRGSFQEATWGDKGVIENLSISLIGPVNDIVNAMTIYGDTVYHIQVVRNACVHLDRDNIERVRIEVLPHYLLRHIHYPTDIIFAEDLATGRMAIINWVDNLNAFLSSV